MLVARGVEKSYGDVRALRGVDLSVDAGQIVALLGRNGAGKSTLLSIVAGLVDADAGSVEIEGVDALRDVDAAAKLIGIAPQETGIYPVLTVRENLEFFGDLAVFPAPSADIEPSRWPIGSDWASCSADEATSCPAVRRGASTRRAHSSTGPACSCSTSRRSGPTSAPDNSSSAPCGRWRPRGRV